MDPTNSVDGVSLSLASAKVHSGIQKTKSKPMFPSEVVNNSEDRVLTNYHDKAVKNYEDGALNNQEVFDNGKSTEFQSKEVNLGNVVTEVSFAPNGDIPAKSNGMFAPNGDIPAKSDGMFAPNGDIPAKSDGMFAPNRDIPAKRCLETYQQRVLG